MTGRSSVSRSPRRRELPGRGALLLLLAVAAACGGSSDGPPRRPRGSAVWVDPESAVLTPEARRTLSTAGIEEAFLEVATVSWVDGEARLLEVPSALNGAVPAGMPVTFVVRGETPPDGMDAGVAGGALAGALRNLRYRAEGAGLLPVGVHLDLEPVSGPEAPADLFETVRRALGSDLLLSTRVSPQRLEEDEVREVADAVDFAVGFLYGQAPGEPDDRTAWDPQQVAARIEGLEALGRDYLVGLYVLGRAERLGPAGEQRATTTLVSLDALARDPSLRLSIDDPFAGVGRLVHTFQAQGASRAAGWRLAPGERIRVTRTAPPLVRDVLDRLEASGSAHLTGYLVHRVAAPEEDLSLAPAELAAALGGGSPVPDLRWKVVVQSQDSDSVLLQVELWNRSRQRTDLAVTDGNYLEIRTDGGYFEGVDPGAFSRYTLWRGTQEARPGTGWREPDGVRLYTPLVSGDEHLTGAVLGLRTRTPQPSLYVSGRFFLPDGRELEIPVEGGPLAPSMAGPRVEPGSE